jgi:hypothetical protein
MPEKFMAALHGTDEINLTVTGRVSGRQISFPVWFAQDRDRLYLLPVRGSDSAWFKNVRAAPGLQLAADGATVTATATPVTDPGRVQEIAGEFRAKYGADQIAAYYSKLDVAVEVSMPASAD